MYELKVVRERKEGYGEIKCFRSSGDVWSTFRNHFEQLDRIAAFSKVEVQANTLEKAGESHVSSVIP